MRPIRYSTTASASTTAPSTRWLSRIQAAGLPYRSLPHGPDDQRVNTQHGGRIVYWSQPGGHVWELLTVSYERQKAG